MHDAHFTQNLRINKRTIPVLAEGQSLKFYNSSKCSTMLIQCTRTTAAHSCTSTKQKITYDKQL